MNLPTIAEIKVSYSNKTPVSKRLSVDTSDKAASLFKHYWDPNLIELQEEFKIMLLNHSNKLLGVYDLSKGSVKATVVDGKLLFAVALKANASKIILCHNHPSGNLTPSIADQESTSKYMAAAKLLDMEIVDHIILSKEGHYSFADEGLLR
jgi:DNA repair protein RadC